MGDQGDSKRRKIIGDNDTSNLCLPVKNEKPVTGWTLKPSENFVHFLHSNKKPKVCLNFWMKNKCNSDCKFKYTHRNNLNKKQANLLTEFVKDIRKAKGNDASGDNV